jgi:hypothetical protein
MEKQTRNTVVNGVMTVAAVAEAIRELGTVPSGTLYAHLMSKLSLEQFQAIVDILVKAELISDTRHQLRWIGPAARYLSRNAEQSASDRYAVTDEG